MKYISVFDIIGPTMVGPSSSHTAGAVRLGLLAGKIYGKEPQKVKFTLYNSFAKTGKGHGTDKGLVGGILGFSVDNPKIPNAYNYAQEKKLEVEFITLNDNNRHPNSVDIEFIDEPSMLISGNSIGGGEIELTEIDGFNVSLRGNLPALLLIYKDKPGMISKVTACIQEANANIATLDCQRKEKGQEASMVICLDSILSENILEKIKNIPEMYVVRSIAALER